MKIPRWLKLREQIDYYLFELGQLYEGLPQSELEKMIDEATGNDKIQLERANKLMKKITRLKKEYEELTIKGE